MKKLVLLLAVAFSVSMFSCGGGDKTEATVDSDSIKKVEAAKADSLKQDSIAKAKKALEEAGNCDDSTKCDSVK